MKYTLELEIKPGEYSLCERCPLLINCPGGMYDEFMCTATGAMAKANQSEHSRVNALCELEGECPLVKST